MKLRIGYINHHVHDFERGVAFFRDVVGLELQFSDASFDFARFDGGTVSFAVAGGGRLVTGRFRIEGVGEIAYFEDTEGNRAAIIQHDPGVDPWTV